MVNFEAYLQGGDLRSIGQVNQLIELITTQHEFESLFQYVYSENRLMAMRAIDAIEKITLKNPKYLIGHNQDIIDLMINANDKELEWHLAILVTRIDLINPAFKKVWNLLEKWAKNRKESKIVRVNSIESLYHLSQQDIDYKEDFKLIINEIKNENVPSINARLRKLKIN